MLSAAHFNPFPPLCPHLSQGKSLAMCASRSPKPTRELQLKSPQSGDFAAPIGHRKEVIQDETWRRVRRLKAPVCMSERPSRRAVSHPTPWHLQGLPEITSVPRAGLRLAASPPLWPASPLWLCIFLPPEGPAVHTRSRASGCPSCPRFLQEHRRWIHPSTPGHSGSCGKGREPGPEPVSAACPLGHTRRCPSPVLPGKATRLRRATDSPRVPRPFCCFCSVLTRDRTLNAEGRHLGDMLGPLGCPWHHSRCRAAQSPPSPIPLLTGG